MKVFSNALGFKLMLNKLELICLKLGRATGHLPGWRGTIRRPISLVA